MGRFKAFAAAAAIVALAGTAPHHRGGTTGSFKIEIPAGPYVAGSRLNISSSGIEGPVSYSVLGPGRVEGSELVIPPLSAAQTATIIASAHGAIALHRIRIVPPPPANAPLLAVATYHNGIALHDPRTFRLIGYVPMGGAPGDVAFDAHGTIVAPDTDSDALARIVRDPWQMQVTHGVLLGNEVAVDPASGSVFVSDRDAGGAGALTRITRSGSVTRVKTGDTAEGLAIDASRRLVYVGNVNDDSVAVVDARSMRVLRKIASVPRTFGIALDRKAGRLFVVSNTSPSMPQGAGYVGAIDLKRRVPRVVMRSARMIFPIGAAIDERSQRLFVTDEVKNAVYVLSTKNLHAVHAPLSTCNTPWRPSIVRGRLYVPCANADKVDVFDLRSLRRVPDAPFSTGGFPLSVALWP